MSVKKVKKLAPDVNAEALAELKYRRMFESTPDGIILVNAETAQIEDISPSLLQLLGYSKESLLDKKIWDIGFLKDTLANKENFDKLQRERYIRYHNLPLVTKDGKKITVEFVSNVYDVGRVKIIQCNIRDSSAYEGVELELKASELKYRTLFEFSSDAIMLISDQSFVDCNPATLKMFGFKSRKEFLEKHPAQVSPPQQADGRDSREAIEERIATALKEGYSIFEWTYRRTNGTDFSAEVMLTSMKFQDQVVMEVAVRDVTERKLSEAKLMKLRQGYERLLDETNIGIFSLTPEPDGRFREVNPTMTRLFGIMGRKEMLNVKPRDLFADPEEYVRFSAEVLEKGAVVGRDCQFRGVDGRIFWGRVSVTKKTDEQGAVYLNGAVDDITELRQSEQKLSEARRRVTELFDKLPVCIYRNTPGPEGVFVEVNPVMVAMFEADSKEDLLKIRVSDLYVNPKDRLLISEKIRRQGSVTDEIVRLKTLKGREIWGAVSAVLSKDEQGNEFFDGVIGDVTSRIELEKALGESEKRFRQIYENSPDALYIMDFKGNFVDGNHAAERVTGYSRKELIGKSMATSGLIGLSDVVKATKLLVMNIAGKPTVPEMFTLKRRDGSPVVVELRTVPTVLDGKRIILGSARDVSERQKALLALSASEDRYRTLVETATDQIFTVDDKYRMLSANKAVTDILRKSAGEIIGKPFTDFFPKGTAAQLSEHIDCIYKTGQALTNLEEKVVFGGEYEAFYSSTLTPIKNETGTVVAVMGVVRDITERMKKEVELREASDKFRRLFASVADAIFVADADTRMLVDCNDNASRLTGYSKEEILSMRADELHPKDKAEETMRGFGEQMAGRILLVASEVLTKAGQRIPVEINAASYAVGKKTCLIGTFRDITERREAEMALAESEDRYRTLIEGINDVVYSLDPQGKITFISKRFERYGWKTEDVVGKNIIEFTAPEDRQAAIKQMQQLATMGKETPIAVRFLSSDGKRFWAETTSCTRRDAAGRTVGVLGVMRDITERKEAEARVEQLHYLKNKFIRIVSHQFRTPLNAIRWNLESLLADDAGKLEPTQRQFIRVIHEANLIVISRIHDLMAAMDIEEGRALLQKDDVSLESLFSSINIDLMKKCQVKNITCRFQRPKAPLPAVLADAEKIRAAMVKLTENSVVYTAENGIIDVALERRGEVIRFSVRDTGIGIPTAEQPNVFIRFYRASNAPLMQPDASGLGLFIAKNFVEQHGGRIGFESEEGKGSTFWFELPLLPPILH